MIHFNRILCPVDFSEFSEHALRYAMKMAASYRASLDVLHVMSPGDRASTGGPGAVGRYMTAKTLESTVERWREPDVAVATELFESARVSESIAQRAEDLDVDLVVTGSHGRTGLQRVLLGSVAESLLHSCRQPVLVVPAHLDLSRLREPMGFRRVICGVDFLPASLTAVIYAMTIAEEAGARLTLVNVMEWPAELCDRREPAGLDIEQARMEAEAERLTRLQALVPWIVRQFCTVEAVVVEGRASRQILRLADQQHGDLIVLGGHGRNVPDPAAVGSNSHDVITLAHCPVLIVPAERRREAVRASLTAQHAEPALVA